jgi:hypothetical protein
MELTDNLVSFIRSFPCPDLKRSVTSESGGAQDRSSKRRKIKQEIEDGQAMVEHSRRVFNVTSAPASVPAASPCRQVSTSFERERNRRLLPTRPASECDRVFSIGVFERTAAETAKVTQRRKDYTYLRYIEPRELVIRKDIAEKLCRPLKQRRGLLPLNREVVLISGPSGSGKLCCLLSALHRARFEPHLTSTLDECISGDAIVRSFSPTDCSGRNCALVLTEPLENVEELLESFAKVRTRAPVFVVCSTFVPKRLAEGVLEHVKLRNLSGQEAASLVRFAREKENADNAVHDGDIPEIVGACGGDARQIILRVQLLKNISATRYWTRRDVRSPFACAQEILTDRPWCKRERDVYEEASDPLVRRIVLSNIHRVTDLDGLARFHEVLALQDMVSHEIDELDWGYGGDGEDRSGYSRRRAHRGLGTQLWEGQLFAAAVKVARSPSRGTQETLGPLHLNDWSRPLGKSLYKPWRLLDTRPQLELHLKMAKITNLVSLLKELAKVHMESSRARVDQVCARRRKATVDVSSHASASQSEIVPKEDEGNS